MMWNERSIARAIALQTLARKCLVLVDNCNWTGYECDVLAVTMDLRIIDVEIKISRSDLKADAKKDKWWHRAGWVQPAVRGQSGHYALEKNLTWPRKVWKHYYAMPAEIWKPELTEYLPSPASGVLLLTDRGAGHTPQILVNCMRRSTPNKDADRIKPEQALDIARLANLRMWEAYNRLDLREVA